MAHHGYLLGIDIGSSSIKASLVSVDSGQQVSSAQAPNEEMPIMALQPGWAEQDPEMWWKYTIESIKECVKKIGANSEEVLAIGIAYQMHGLVCIDKNQNVVRPSIIWCDSRAAEIGKRAFHDLGEKYCLQRLLNSPGNFTGSKLKWVKENEPALFDKIHMIMLPGDFIAMRLSGEISTTASGLSEGIFWDYKEGSVSKDVLSFFEFTESILPEVVSTFAIQCTLQKSAAEAVGLKVGIPISYRSGDQPNNAFSLNVLNPGETAATAGTSGVIYTVTDKNAFDTKSRVNTFMHVNSKSNEIRNGVLLCVNGSGILNSWLRKNGGVMEYEEMNRIAARAPIGSDGVTILPFGNGAERILENLDHSASFHGLSFTRHGQAHLYRAAQEGIVFALKYGFTILDNMDLKTQVIRAGNANMFLSPVFREAFVNTIGVRLELYDTDGASGAAIGAGIGAGIFSSFNEGFKGLKLISFEEPQSDKIEQYQASYTHWESLLKSKT